MERISIKGERHALGGSGIFYLGDAVRVSELLLAEGCETIDLIYLDPPFGTGDTFSYKQSSRGKKIELPAYSDKLSESDYMSMMRSVLTNCQKLLTPQGSIYLHIDQRMSSKLRLMMDEIFGEKNFLNEIIWSYRSGGRSTRHFPRKHDTILFYRKTKRVKFNISAVGVLRGDKKRNNMKKSVDNDGRVYFSIRTNGRIYKYYEDSLVFPSDVWDDIEHLQQKDPERTGYSTQKPEALLRRIILASSDANDTVLDLFSGSGTAAAAAASLGRRFIAADASPIALNVLRKRLVHADDSVSLLSEAQPLDIRYISAPADSISVSARSTVCGELVNVFEISYSGGAGLSSLMLGGVKDELFYPVKYVSNLLPSEEYSFSLSSEYSPAMLCCDMDGSLACFAL